jgi:hypothetical protein
MCMMLNKTFNKVINKGQSMKESFKLLIVASAVALFTACGGGGGGSGDVSTQPNGDNSVAELAQKIRNGFNVIGAATIINGSNN